MATNRLMPQLPAPGTYSLQPVTYAPPKVQALTDHPAHGNSGLHPQQPVLHRHSPCKPFQKQSSQRPRGQTTLLATVQQLEVQLTHHPTLQSRTPAQLRQGPTHQGPPHLTPVLTGHTAIAALTSPNQARRPRDDTTGAVRHKSRPTAATFTKEPKATTSTPRENHDTGNTTHV